MKFVEITKDFSIRVDSIVSVNSVDGELIIQTEEREYKVVADFELFMSFIEHQDVEQKNKMVTQFFGG